MSAFEPTVMGAKVMGAKVMGEELVEGQKYLFISPGASNTLQFVGTYSGIYKNIKTKRKLKIDGAIDVVVENNNVLIQKPPMGRMSIFDNANNEYYMM